jgi:hypothetical protein
MLVVQLIFQLKYGGLHWQFAHTLQPKADHHILTELPPLYFVFLEEYVEERLHLGRVTLVNEGSGWNEQMVKHCLFYSKDAVSFWNEKVVIIGRLFLLLHLSSAFYILKIYDFIPVSNKFDRLNLADDCEKSCSFFHLQC